MGIAGLLPLLKEIQVAGEIKHFKGKTLAVDAYVWLHKGAFGCAEALVKGQKTTKVRMLKYHGITPFIVFDGGPLPAKKGTEVSRAKSRAENLARAQALEAQGQHRAAREFYTKCVDITPEMAYQFIKALRAENVQYIVAPYEADAQLCYLERNGFVDGIITEDSDLLVFGCRQVIFKLDNDGKCVWIHRDQLAQVPSTPMHGWTETEFRRMAMLSGCDYLDSIQGIGIKKAHALLRRHKTVEKVLYNIRMDGAMKIPPNYVERFNQAELAFLHQRVFDPVERRLVPLNDFPANGLKDEDERWIGLCVHTAFSLDTVDENRDLAVEVARGIALGDLHPETREPIEDLWPTFQPSGSSGKNSNSSKALQDTSKGNVKIGPMDGFIKREYHPESVLITGSKASKTVLPNPVGAPSSGVKSLSDLRQRSSMSSSSSSFPVTFGRKPSRASSKFFSAAPPVTALETEIAKQTETMQWESSQPPDVAEAPVESMASGVEDVAPYIESQAHSISSQAGPSRPTSRHRKSSPPMESLPSPVPSPSPVRRSPPIANRSNTPARVAPFNIEPSSPVAVSSPVSSEAAVFSPPHLKRTPAPPLPHASNAGEQSSPTPFQRPHRSRHLSNEPDPKSSSSVASRVAESMCSQESIIRPLPDTTFKVTISSDSAEDERIVTPSAEAVSRNRLALAKGKRSVSTPVTSAVERRTGTSIGKRSASDSILPNQPSVDKQRKKRKTENAAPVDIYRDEELAHISEPEDDEETLQERAKEEERVATAARISAGWKAKYSFTALSPSTSSPSLLGKRAKSNQESPAPKWSITKSTTPQPLSASMPKILAPLSLNAPIITPRAIAKPPPGFADSTPRRAFSAGGAIPSSGLKKASAVPFSTPAPHTPAGAAAVASGGGGLGRFMFSGKVDFDPRRFG